MFVTKFMFQSAGASLARLVSLEVQPIRAQTSSESKEIEKLKREVAELK
jgi:hypothetical protein